MFLRFEKNLFFCRRCYSSSSQVSTFLSRFPVFGFPSSKVAHPNMGALRTHTNTFPPFRFQALRFSSLFSPPPPPPPPEVKGAIDSVNLKPGVTGVPLENPFSAIEEPTYSQVEEIIKASRDIKSGEDSKVLRSLIFSKCTPAMYNSRYQIHHQRSSIVEDELDPFSLVADELSLIGNKLGEMVVAKVPQFAPVAEYFFKIGVEGKRFRPTVLLLMSTALHLPMPKAPLPIELGDTMTTDLRSRQQRIVELTEMIHVASLLHDDVLYDEDTRRSTGSLNFVMGNKLAVLAGDFLLSRACADLASLKNTDVVGLLAKAVEHIVTGETMQMTTASDQWCSMEYYMEKTCYKTASLISKSCKAIAILTGQTAEVAILAFEYGKNLGLAFQLIDDVLDFTGTSASLGKGSLSDIQHEIVTAPILFAMEEFPQLRAIVEDGFDNPENVNTALDYLGKSRGIERTRELAIKHANLAAAIIDSLPDSDDEEVRKSRRALINITRRVITRTK